MGDTLRDGEQSESTFDPNANSSIGRSLDDRSFRLLFARIPLGLCVVTADHWIREVNRAMTEMLGYAEGELVGKSIDEITNPADLAQSEDFVRQVHQPDSKRQTIVKRYRRKDGTVVFGKVMAMSIRDETDTICHAFAIVEDLTEQRQAEDDRERARESEAIRATEQARLERVLQTVRETTHQVGNALTEAQGYTQLALLRSDLPAETRELLTLSMNGFEAVTAYLQSLRKIWVIATAAGTPVSKNH